MITSPNLINSQLKTHYPLFRFLLTFVSFLRPQAEHGSVSICDYGKNFALIKNAHSDCDYGDILEAFTYSVGDSQQSIRINVISDLFSQRLISLTTTTTTKSSTPWFRMPNQMKTKSFGSKHRRRKTGIIGLCLCMRREKYTEIRSMHKTLEYYVRTE